MTTSSFTSNTNIDFDYIPDVDDYGSQTISFTAYDADTGGLSSVDTSLLHQHDSRLGEH